MTKVDKALIGEQPNNEDSEEAIEDEHGIKAPKILSFEKAEIKETPKEERDDIADEQQIAPPKPTENDQ